MKRNLIVPEILMIPGRIAKMKKQMNQMANKVN